MKWLVAAGILGCVASSASAESAHDAAKRLFLSGNQHFALAEYDQAVADFKEAYRHKEDPALLYNIAQCYHQMKGQEELALKMYRSYLQNMPSPPNREEVTRKIEELEKLVTRAEPPPPSSPSPPSPSPSPSPTAPDSTPNATPVAAPLPAIRWVASVAGALPPGAFVGGEESGRGLVVCRTAYRGGTQSGKVVGQACNFGYGGVEVMAPQFDVLVAPLRGVSWIPATTTPPANVIYGGAESGRYLPVCRAAYAGGWHPGRQVGPTCVVGFAGREVAVGQFEVLVAGQAVPRARAVEAGPIWNNGQAQQTCPRICAGVDARWNGQWRTTVAGRMSVCDCL